MKKSWSIAPWVMAAGIILSFSASWAGVHTHLPRGINAANDTVEVDAGDTFIAAKATIDSLVLIIRDTTITGVSIYRLEAFNLHNPNQLGQFVPAGGGKLRLVSAYDDYRIQERNTSIVRTEGKMHPDWGIKIITAGQDSLVTVDGANHSRPFVFVGGASNAILDATPVMTSITTQDGRDWVSGTGGTDWTIIDWMADQVYQWDTANYLQYKGTITNRNAGSGWLALATSPVIVNASVNDGEVIRSPWATHRDQFGRQLSYWTVATPGGVSADFWNATSTLSIFDSGDTANSILMLDDGSILSIQDDATKDNLHWTYRTQSITADSWTQNETWSNAGTGSEDLRWGNAVVMSDVAAIPGASSAGRNSPRIMIGTTTQGLALLDAKAGDNTNGAKAYIDASISTSLLYGDVMAAWSPATSAQLEGYGTITSESGVTRTTTVAGPESHGWNYDFGDYSVITDHDSLTFVAGQPFTIMIGAYLSDVTDVALIAKYTYAPKKEWMLATDTDGYLFLTVDDNTQTTNIGRKWTTALTGNKWLHIVAIYTGGTTASSCQLWVNGIRVDNANYGAGSFITMRNTSSSVFIGCAGWTADEPGNIHRLTGSLTAPRISRSIVPESVIKRDYAKFLAAINSPTNDVLTSSAVLRVKANPLGKHIGVLNASRLEVRDVHGALIDTLACTPCGTLADFAWAPVPTDSFGVYLGGSTGYRAYVPDVRAEALAQYEWPDHSVIFNEGSVSVDSAGYGDFWHYSDASAALGVVAQPQEIRHLSNPDSSRYRAKFLSTGDTLYSKGTTLIGDAATDVTIITSDSNFVTGGAVIGIAGGVRQRYVDSTVDSLRFTNGSVTFEGGNVGIGTTGPGSKLDITTAGLAATQTTSSGLALVNTTAATAIAPVQISPAVRWSGAGWKTDVTAASQAVDFRSYVVPVQGAANPTGYLSFGSSVNGAAYSDGQLVLTTAGNVGIGTLTPGAKLDVSPSVGYVNFKLLTRPYLGATYSSQSLVLGHSVKAYEGETDQLVVTETNSGAGAPAAIKMTTGRIEFHTASSGTADAVFSSERMRITNGGNVGIGTMGPAKALHVKGQIAITPGTAAAPSIVDSLDTNSGFNTFGTDTVGIVTGGVTRVRVGPSGKILVATSSYPTNSEVYIGGELVLGDGATDNNHDLRINAGASYSEIDAGETQFAISSLSAMKTAITPLVDVTALRSVFRDSTTVQTWQWKREMLYQQRIVDEIMADSLRVPDLVLEEVAKREKIQVDTDTAVIARTDTLVSTSRDSVIALAVIDSLGEMITPAEIVTLYDTLQIIETYYDTTLTLILYTVTSPERRAIGDSIRAAIVGAAEEKAAAYNARIDAKANRQHIGIMAEDAYRIAQIIASEAAEPGVLDGNILQAALVQMAIVHERELDSLKTMIVALQKRANTMQIDFDARLKILEAR